MVTLAHIKVRSKSTDDIGSIIRSRFVWSTSQPVVWRELSAASGTQQLTEQEQTKDTGSDDFKRLCVDKITLCPSTHKQ